VVTLPNDARREFSGPVSVIDVACAIGPWPAKKTLNNVFDTKYATAGALSENPFNAAGTFQSNSGICESAFEHVMVKAS